MIPFSKLFAMLVLLGIVPILVGSFIGMAFYVFAAYNVLLFLLLVIDFIITPGRKSFEVSRQCDEKFSLGAENEVVIRVRNNSRYLLNMEFRDTIPPFFKVKASKVKIKAVPHYDCEGGYHAVPEKRGEFVFGNIFYRYNGVLRLCSKSGKSETSGTYNVYPNLRDLRRFGLAALKKSQLEHGMKRSRAYGIGTEFESLKEYNEGDDYRKINWLATARASKLIVNTYEPEKNQHVYILLDSSRVMNSEINFIKKLDYAINSSFLLADIAIKKGDNTGLLVFDSSVRRFVKTGKGMGHFELIADNLYNIEENLVSADYKGALVYLNEHHKRRSLLCIFTELFNADEALSLAAALKNIARRHIPLVITIKDMRLYDIASGSIKDTSDVFLKSASLKLIEEREKIRRIFSDSGIAALDVPPDKLSVEVVNKYLAMKSTLQI